MSSRAVAGPAVLLLLIVAVLALRVAGPSDIWDQAQPRTIAYTVCLLADERPEEATWILPTDVRGDLTTKPPLYNWLAVPLVAIIGPQSEFAHKFPSIVAFIIAAFAVARLGRSFGVAWPAAIVFVANYPLIKLGYLARPDMILIAAIAVALDGALALLNDDRSPRRGVWQFWGGTAVACLAKGPPALALPVAIGIAALLIGGRPVLRRLRPVTGLLLSLVPFIAWVALASLQDFSHVRDVLWGSEFRDRILGNEHATGPFAMPAYFFVRFAPWSLLFVPAAIAAWRADPRLRACVVVVVVVIAGFSLSSGKRADYIAIAYPAAALVVAWWLHAMLGQLWARVAVAGGVAVALTVVTIGVVRDDAAPAPGFGQGMLDFAAAARPHLEAEPLPVYTCWTEHGPLKPLVGVAVTDHYRGVRDAVRAGEDCWILTGRSWRRDERLEERPDIIPHLDRLRPIVRSALMPCAKGWPTEATLYRVSSNRGSSSDN